MSEQSFSGATRQPSSALPAGILLGVGFGGFFDGIVLHQILQWHHLLTSTGDHPATTVVGLEANTLADGLFHALTFACSLAGVFMLWAAARRGAVPATRVLLGSMLLGWGLFNLVEGLVDHQILTIHHVNYENVALWDAAFLIFGAVLAIGGWALIRPAGSADHREAG
jgi:uncharacterized membrane protein